MGTITAGLTISGRSLRTIVVKGIVIVLAVILASSRQ